MRPCAAVVILVASGILHAADGGGHHAPDRVPLWSHIAAVADLGEVRHLAATWSAAEGGTLALTGTARAAYASATIPVPREGWNLARRAAVEAVITNRGTRPTTVQLWAVASRGWESVGDFATLAPGEERRFSCDLRERFPDGTAKLDPRRVEAVRIILRSSDERTAIDVARLEAGGTAAPWAPPPGRIEVPAVDDGPPAAGRRVRLRFPGDEASGIHFILHLPDDWSPTGKYPVILEYPGNEFYVRGCYSTGLPEQCGLGYGMSRGRGAIWVSLPFVDRRAGTIVASGWGDPDATADCCVRVVEEVCGKFGGDPAALVLTGFSRGAIACGFIGLRNERIANLWKGFHLCQHYDGDGWNGADMAGAIGRARRFRGAGVFHTDNPESRVRPVTEALGVPATFVQSGLGAHATAMVLDDRESTRRLRAWFAELVAAPTAPAAR